MPVKLENVTSRIFQGIKTSADKIYIVEELERQRKRVKVYSRQKGCDYWLEPDLLHPLVKGGDSKRYYLARTNRLLLFPYAARDGTQSRLLPPNILKAEHPLTWAYLSDNKHYLESREDGRMRGAEWYAYIYPKALDVMPLPKIFTPDIAAQAAFSLDPVGNVFFTGGVAGGYGILVLPEHSREYILGLLNSKLLEWCIRQTATQMRGGYYSYESRFIRHLPICIPEPAEKPHQDKIAALVERMLELNEKKHSGRLALSELNQVERETAATDAKIDALVYDLYRITRKERSLIERELR